MNEKQKEIRTQNQKAMPKFVAVLVLCMLVGGVVGFTSAVASDSAWTKSLPMVAQDLMNQMVPFGIPVFGLLLLVPAGILLYRAKRMHAGWDGEDEAAADQIEYLLSWSTSLAGLLQPISFFFFSAAMGAAYTMHYNAGLLLSVTVELLVETGLVFWFQKVTVELTRVMNPEKQGSVYELDFHKKWVNSCDENEMRKIGMASYQSFRATNKVCMILWLLLTTLQGTFHTGILPVAVVILIWMVSMGSYFLSCIRQEKRAR